MSYTYEEEEYRGCTIRIEQDDNPESPREWDNVGTMVCFHDRYNLGDVQEQRGSGDDYLRGLVPGCVTEPFEVRRARVHANCHTGYGRPKRLPGEVCDALYERIDKAEQAAIEKWLDDNLIMLTLHLYDHSGISISCRAFSCPWDSGRVGFIYCTMERARKEWGPQYFPGITDDEIRAKARAHLEAEVDIYDDYLTRQVAGYVAEDPDGNHIESCWGFYPDHSGRDEWAEPIGQARDAIDHWHERQDKESAERQHWAERDVITT